MNDEFEKLKEENRKLKIDLATKEAKILEIQKQVQSILNDKEAIKSNEMNRILQEKGRETENNVWKDTIFKLAHAINNDLHSAGHALSKTTQDNQIKKAISHLQRVQDLVDLNIWWLKKDELSEEWKNIDIENLIKDLIESVKDGISTLRVSDALEKKIERLNVKPEKRGDDTTITTGREKYPEMISLIILDLIRNAFKHIDENNPWVKININCDEKDFVGIDIINSGSIGEKFVHFLNTREGDPDISDSSKVGLRSIIQWVDYLNLGLSCENLIAEKACLIKLKIPRIIYFEI